MAKRTAIIDIGSNSIKLSIYEKSSRYAFFKICEEKVYTKLGLNSYNNNNILEEQSLSSTLNALKLFKERIEEYTARKILCVATSALRDAPNNKEFISKVAKETGIKIKLISGEREGFLTALGAINLLPKQEKIIIVDIGGGSSEFTLVENGHIKESISLKLGNVRIKDMFIMQDNKEGAKEYIKNELKLLPDYFKNHKLVVTGGATKEISDALMPDNYPLKDIHSFEYDTNTNLDFIKKISNMSQNELGDIGISSNRLDTTKEGAFIFYYILKYLSPNIVQTSKAGLREGLYLNDLLRSSKLTFPTNFNTSLKSILDRFEIDKKGNDKRQIKVKALFNQYLKTYDIKQYETELLYAMKLLFIGRKLSFEEYPKHSHYIVINELCYGLSHKQRVLIASLVRFQNKKSIKNSYYEDHKQLLPDKKVLNLLQEIIFECK